MKFIEYRWTTRDSRAASMALKRAQLTGKRARRTSRTSPDGALNVAIRRSPFVWMRRSGRGDHFLLASANELGLRLPVGTLGIEFLPKKQPVATTFLTGGTRCWHAIGGIRLEPRRVRRELFRNPASGPGIVTNWKGFGERLGERDQVFPPEVQACTNWR